MLTIMRKIGQLLGRLFGKQSNARRYKRLRCEESVAFVRNGKRFYGKILNTSLGGICLLTTELLNSDHKIAFPSPSFETKVVWARNRRIGLEFTPTDEWCLNYARHLA